MHAQVLHKDFQSFWGEIETILNGTSKYHRPIDCFDFSGFGFPDTNFYRYRAFGRKTCFHMAQFWGKVDFPVEFRETADFSSARFRTRAFFANATFEKDAYFQGAFFHQDADFTGKFGGVADFSAADFRGQARFPTARFETYADFCHTHFRKDVIFVRTQFGRSDNTSGKDVRPVIADFRSAEFCQPGGVRFHLVNNESNQGFRARLLGCRVENLYFEDVSWNKLDGRMVLEDELDLKLAEKITNPSEYGKAIEAERPQPRHELVAIIYRQMVKNFERGRAYDLAEDCFVGEMEIKRLDPEKPRFVRTTISLYRGASYYGSSYKRALGILLLLVFIFGLAYALPFSGLQSRSLTPTTTITVPNPWIEIAKDIGAGIFHSLEIATFQREPTHVAASIFGRLVKILETILVPSQLALLLLALRRRLRR
jgi:uncharacterized protein YjbI with pentapeptide repeats